MRARSYLSRAAEHDDDGLGVLAIGPRDRLLDHLKGHLLLVEQHDRSRFFTSVAATASSCFDGSVRACNKSSADCRASSADESGSSSRRNSAISDARSSRA